MNKDMFFNLIHLYGNGYKRYQTILIFKILFIIAAVAYAFNYFWSLVETDYLVNSAIIFLIVAGTVYCFLSLRSIEREVELLFSLQEDFQHGISCNETRFDILFLIARTFNTILSERGILYINSSSELNAIIKSYVDNISARIFYIGFASAMCVSLGLFGTFMGLTETIAAMSTLLSNLYGGLADENADILTTMVQLIGELQAPLAGMALAFATSLLGLIGSMILSLQIVLLNRAANYAQANLENWLTLLLIPNDEKEDAVSDAISKALETLTTNNTEQMQTIANSLQALSQNNNGNTEYQEKMLAVLEKIAAQQK